MPQWICPGRGCENSLQNPGALGRDGLGYLREGDGSCEQSTLGSALVSWCSLSLAFHEAQLLTPRPASRNRSAPLFQFTVSEYRLPSCSPRQIGKTWQVSDRLDAIDLGSKLGSQMMQEG